MSEPPSSMPSGPRVPDSDRVACESLIHAFCHRIDHGQPELVVDLFTADGVFDRKGEALRGRDALLAFCIKEALFKAQYPLTRRMLDFRDVPAIIRARRFRACLGKRLIGGTWGIAGGYYLAISLWRG